MTNKYQTLVEFYKKHFDKVYSFYFYKVNRDIALAEDLTQNAFTRAFEKLELYNTEYAFSTWFWRLANNLLIDHYRSKKEKHHINLEEIENLGKDPKIAELTEQQLQLEKVYEALEKIPEQKKELIILYYISEIPISVIADMFNTSGNNIRVQISRAIAKLSHNLASYG